jgi:hypothetical protein
MAGVRADVFSDRDDTILKLKYPHLGFTRQRVTTISTVLYDDEEGMRASRGDEAVDDRIRFLAQWERGVRLRKEALNAE